MVYFSNGTEGMILDEQCGKCPLHDEGCPVYGVQQLYNYDQLDDGQEKLKDAMSMLVNEKGVCQVREAMKRASKINPKSLPSFLRMDKKS